MRDPDGLFQALQEALHGRSLYVVSNREPYTHRRQRGRVMIERATGGLVTGLDPILCATSGTWLAWGHGDADFAVTDEAGRVAVPPEGPRYTLKRIGLGRAEVRGAYHGYANQVLWPLCHLMPGRAHFRGWFWPAFQRANQRFAEAVQGEAAPDSTVWLQDYHLALCPRMIRQIRPDLFLMHFWHIPWPAWDVFRLCPQRTELLDGLLANDLIGFQHPRHVLNFLDCAAREVSARVDLAEGVIAHGGRSVKVDAFPISVDAAALERLASSPACARWMRWLRRRWGLNGRAVVVSVDRLDYTKGILERLQAIERFFHRWPSWRSRVVFVQKMAPSRSRIPAYRDLQIRVEEEIARINGRFGVRGWQPIIYVSRAIPAAALAALYRMAEVCLVTPLQDGMNLVAKEFVACQVDHRGVLVLSEFAGAAHELTEAITVNPHDGERLAAAIAFALGMPAEERTERMSRLRAQVTDHDVFRWAERQFRTAARLRNARQAAYRMMTEGSGVS